MDFLPKNYQAPKSSNFYMKLQEGENKLRILSQPIIGWEDWKDNKPMRFKFEDKPLRPVDAKRPIRHFWAVIVWNYTESQIQILHITQASIRKTLETLCNDADWGAPYFYDLKITKTGEGMDTEYHVTPLPHKPTSPAIIKEFNDRPCNLEALFDNLDPFSKEYKRFTPGIFEKVEEVKSVQIDKVKKSEKITAAQAFELEDLLVQCTKDFAEKVYQGMESRYGAKEIKDFPAKDFEEIKLKCIKNIAQFGIAVAQ